LIQNRSGQAAIRREHLNDLCATLEEVLSGQTARLEKGLSDRKKTTEELERNLKNLSEEKEALNVEFNERSKEFRRKWERKISEFKGKEDQISGETTDILSKKFETADLSELMKRKKRLQMDVSEAVLNKIKPYIEEIEGWFAGEWEKFNEDLIASVRNRTNKTMGGSDVYDFIVKTVDAAGKVAYVAPLGGAAIAAVYSLNAYLTAMSAAGLAQIGVWWAGGATALASAALLTSVPGLAACAGVFFGSKFLKNKLMDWKRGDVLEKLPKLVKEDLSPCIGEVVEKLTELYGRRIEDMRGSIFEKISAVEKQEKDILEAAKSNDPSIFEHMKDELEYVYVLGKRFAELKNLARAEAAEYA
jgi:hypothetical protein